MTARFDRRLELFYDGEWRDHTSDLRKDLAVGLEHGRSSWADDVSPTMVTIVVNDDHGRYSINNPISDLYKKVGQGTPIRYLHGPAGGPLFRRFVGEVIELRPQYVGGARQGRTVAIDAADALHRLQRPGVGERAGGTVRASARLTLGQFEPRPAAYWPLEERTGAVLGREVRPGWPAMVQRGFGALPAGGSRVVFGVDDAPPGAARAVRIDVGALRGPVQPPEVQPPSPVWTVAGAVKISALDVGSNLLIGRSAPGEGIEVALALFAEFENQVIVGLYVGGSPTGVVVMEHAFPEGRFIDQWHHYAFTALQSGSSIFFGFWVDGKLVDTHVLASTTMGRVAAMEAATLNTPLTLSAWSAWHADLTSELPQVAAAVLGYPGERAGRRIERIAVEEGVPLGVVGSLDDTQRMGPQLPVPAMEAITDAATASAGLLYAPPVATRAIGGFESGTTEGWSGGGSPAPTVEATQAQAHTGAWSLLVTWQGGSGLQLIQRDSPQAIFAAGLSYTVSMAVRVTSGGPPVRPVVAGLAIGDASTGTDAFEVVSVSFIATGDEHSVQMWADGPTQAGDTVYVDDIVVTADMPAIGFRTLGSVVNREPTLHLDGSAGEIMIGFRPMRNDERIRNEVTVSRPDGGEFTEIADDPEVHGPFNVLAPHLGGIGRYDYSLTVGVETDRRVRDRARWELHHGIWPEATYSELGVSLTRAAEQNPELIVQAAAVQLLDRITVTPPGTLPVGTEIDQVVHGWSEVMSSTEWEIRYRTTPYAPLRIPIVSEEPGGTGEGVARFGSHYTSIAQPVDATQTAIPVMTQFGRADWITTADYPDHFPFDVMAGGERWTVEAIAGAESDHRPASVTETTTPTTDHVAPSVTPVRAGALLICAWCSWQDPGTYTPPGSMTEHAQTSGSWSTMLDATETVPAGATGTRTAVLSTADVWAATSDSFDAGVPVAVEEQLSGFAAGGTNVQLATGAGTMAGWFLVAIQAWDQDDAGLMQAPTPGEWFSLNGTAPSAFTSRIRVWARMVETSGPQQVSFLGAGSTDNHARLYVVSGQLAQEWTVTRSVNGVVKTHDANTKVVLHRRHFVRY